MSIIVCGQFDILGDECPGCGSNLHRVIPGGFEADGWRYCEPECFIDWSEWRDREHVARRDLLCTCDICTAAGHPTPAELQEYADYQASIKGTPLDPNWVEGGDTTP